MARWGHWVTGMVPPSHRPWTNHTCTAALLCVSLTHPEFCAAQHTHLEGGAALGLPASLPASRVSLSQALRFCFPIHLLTWVW